MDAIDDGECAVLPRGHEPRLIPMVGRRRSVGCPWTGHDFERNTCQLRRLRGAEVAELQCDDFVDDGKLSGPPVVAHQLVRSRRNVALEEIAASPNRRTRRSSWIRRARWLTAMLERHAPLIT